MVNLLAKMPPKTKNKSRRSRPAVKFTIRRISNKNPRNARTFRQFRRKLSRATAGLLALGLIASGLFLNGNELKSNLVDSIKTPNNSICKATEITSNFEKITTKLSELSRDFPELIENLDFCKKEGSCVAEDQIYENENKIWQLEKNLTELKTNNNRAKEEFTIALSKIENEVLFCANEASCKITEAELSKARECEKEFQTSSLLFETREIVENKYSLVTEKGSREPAIVYTKKLMDDIFKNRERVNKNKENYSQCVEANDESVCQKYLQKVNESEEKITDTVMELGKLQIDILDIIKVVENDIVALEIGRSDPQNIEEDEGLGWCTEKLKTNKATLFTKISNSTTQKLLYEIALKDLTARKLALQASLQADLEAAAMHAAAEKAAEEEVMAATAAAKISAEKRAQAEVIFGIWSAVRNSF